MNSHSTPFILPQMTNDAYLDSQMRDMRRYSDIDNNMTFLNRSNYYPGKMMANS